VVLLVVVVVFLAVVMTTELSRPHHSPFSVPHFPSESVYSTLVVVVQHGNPSFSLQQVFGTGLSSTIPHHSLFTTPL